MKKVMNIFILMAMPFVIGISPVLAAEAPEYFVTDNEKWDKDLTGRDADSVEEAVRKQGMEFLDIISALSLTDLTEGFEIPESDLQDSGFEAVNIANADELLPGDIFLQSSNGGIAAMVYLSEGQYMDMESESIVHQEEIPGSVFRRIADSKVQENTSGEAREKEVLQTDDGGHETDNGGNDSVEAPLNEEQEAENREDKAEEPKKQDKRIALVRNRVVQISSRRETSEIPGIVIRTRE